MPMFPDSSWLAARSLFGFPRWSVIGLAALLIALAVLLLIDRIGTTAAHHNQTQREAGAASQRAQDLETTLKRTEEGNAARIEIRDPRGSARYDQCLRSARTPENCQRFLPE
ncbi:hypothetical protein HGI47_18470 [Novosphingobium sp. ERN07]|uniref:hypothetical protein n=1 Tax=Novosphingobium sp. ERN07 TaxID=2726187 RepID=UPI0014575DC1|nr:hypothetical protein [Novosphingobium sp. ERN07]NLR72864.1 hypothetical protein [Novosphingobium sp. ERN07]